MINLAGQTFGKYLVLGESHKTLSSTYWLCRCVCGIQKPVKSTHLRSGEASGCRSCRGLEQAVKMAGKRFGDYCVLSKSRKRKGHTYWLCVCLSCQNDYWVEGNNLRAGKSTRCRGCGLRGKNVTDLTGLRSNSLTVIKAAGIKSGMSLWLVRCICGQEKILPAEQIASTKSCGCLRRRKAESHPNFKHDKSAEDRLLSKGRALLPNYRTWVNHVKAAFDHKCLVCGSSTRLVAHHLESFRHYPDRRTDISNGVCLCSKHHRAFHQTYGNRERVTTQNFNSWACDLSRQPTDFAPETTLDRARCRSKGDVL